MKTKTCYYNVINFNLALFFTLWLCVNYNYSNYNTNDSPELILLELKDSHLYEKQNYKKPQPFTLRKKSKHLLQLKYMLFSHKKKEKKVIRQWSYRVRGWGENVKYKNGSTKYQSVYIAEKR